LVLYIAIFVSHQNYLKKYSINLIELLPDPTYDKYYLTLRIFGQSNTEEHQPSFNLKKPKKNTTVFCKRAAHKMLNIICGIYCTVNNGEENTGCIN